MSSTVAASRPRSSNSARAASLISAMVCRRRRSRKPGAARIAVVVVGSVSPSLLAAMEPSPVFAFSDQGYRTFVIRLPIWQYLPYWHERAILSMKLNIGDTLVYPHHGAVTVTELTRRPFNSTETTFVRFRVHHNGLMIELPAANADKVGIRRAIGSRGVKQVFAILGSPTPAAPAKEVWSQRFKTNQAKITTGDVFQVSEVV